MDKLVRALALAVSLGAAGLAFAADAVKVVYHINNIEQAGPAVRNIRNHLTADPSAKIVVVTHATGIDWLLEGAEDKNKNPYSVMVEDLADKGVEFRVCNFTLLSRNIDKSKVIPQAKIVPSGVAEVSRLQAQEGFVYLKP